MSDIIGPVAKRGRINGVHKKFIESVGELRELEPIDYSGPAQTLVNMATYIFRSWSLKGSATVISQDIFSLRLGYFSKLCHGSNIIHLEAGDGFMYPQIMEDSQTRGLKTISQKIDGAIAVSPLAKKYLENYYEGPIEIAYPFISDDIRERIENADYETQEGKILYVGRNHYRKGLDLLLEAFKEVKKGYPGTELHIVGTDDHDFDTSGERVHDHGYVSIEELVKHYCTADLYVLPARADAHPVSVLEAMLAGTPVIMTETTGTKYLVDDLPDYFISEANPESIKSSMNSYFRRSDIERQVFSSKVKGRFKEEKQISLFEDKVREWL